MVDAKTAVVPAMKVVARMTVQALDSLPLPLLVVLFLALLASLQWPLPTKDLLPTYSPPSPRLSTSSEEEKQSLFGSIQNPPSPPASCSSSPRLSGMGRRGSKPYGGFRRSSLGTLREEREVESELGEV